MVPFIVTVTKIMWSLRMLKCPDFRPFPDYDPFECPVNLQS